MLKKSTHIIAVLALLSVLSGCAGSLARNVSDPARRDFKIDGFTIAVVPQGDHWSAWYVPQAFIGAMPPLPLLKNAEKNAIEQYSSCKVTSADLVDGSLQPAYLQAIVNCTEPK